MDEKELLNLKEKINQAKTKVFELKGRQDYLMQDLKDNWKCVSVDSAQTTLQTYEKEIEETSNKIEKATMKLKEKYDV
jgi:flagellar biosynthesis chaperone FliJ